MANTVPRLASWCVHCRQEGGFCSDHEGGKDYDGPDVYEPSAGFLDIVGKPFEGPLQNYTCTGYDPRCGFWMLGADGRETNVSERAINRTFHEQSVRPDGNRVRRFRG